MTALELYKKALIEINKMEAPSLLLEDYNYFINKAIQQYTNKVYNRYDVNQQSTDDLNALKATAVLSINEGTIDTILPIEEKRYYVNLPSNYLHLLNCVVEFTLKDAKDDSSSVCGNKSDDEDGHIFSLARRMTADQYPSLIKNAYFRPTYNRPYYFINGNSSDGTDDNNALNDILNPCNTDNDNIVSTQMEIRCGKSKYKPDKVRIDYIKQPRIINLELDAIEDNVTDSSETVEFPEYVCYEIINEFVKLLLENASDPRLQTNNAVNQTINTGTQTSKS